MFFKALCHWATPLRRTLFTRAALLTSLAALSAHGAFAADSSPNAADYDGKAIDRIAPRFVLSAQRPLWPNAQINYYYNPQDQPAGISTADMEGLLRSAARKWENVCNVRFNYLGTTAVRPNLAATFETTDRVNVVGWELLTGSQAQFSGYVSWWYQNQGNAMIDADMFLNISGGAQFARNKPGLGALLTHEMGHMLAISHSNVQQSVMFAEPYNDFTYQATLRGDDAAACTTMYGPSAKIDANRIFNWTEQTFTQFLSPVGSTSQDLEGYHYRFYPSTNSYIAERNGVLYYLPVGGSVITLGTVTQFMPSASGAGF
ncbi:MAG: hypothetical protein CFE43_04180 [Burkholderiales bacterium PBB3]|nr:MAG: hypothetical protein CFE43_04180 [Burkholderiales bacterium PBB3]